jgi:NADPH-dependent FMN reductase
MDLLAIPGSLRSSSSNRTLLEAAAALAPDGVTVHLSEHLAALPHFNPDLDGPARPPAATAWAAAVGAADGLLVRQGNRRAGRQLPRRLAVANGCVPLLMSRVALRLAT